MSIIFKDQFKNIIPFLSYQLIKKEQILTVSKSYFFLSFYMLKNHINYQYKLLSCISGVDLISNEYRFCVAYDLLSITFNSRLRVKIFVNETSTIPTLSSIYVNSNWWEREIWDLFGIYFTGHPDLRRILTDYGFEGHPLRKDFPLTGYTEARYDLKKKRVVSEAVELSQEFRSFNFDIVW